MGSSLFMVSIFFEKHWQAMDEARPDDHLWPAAYSWSPYLLCLSAISSSLQTCTNLSSDSILSVVHEHMQRILRPSPSKIYVLHTYSLCVVIYLESNIMSSADFSFVFLHVNNQASRASKSVERIGVQK